MCRRKPAGLVPYHISYDGRPLSASLGQAGYFDISQVCPSSNTHIFNVTISLVMIILNFLELGLFKERYPEFPTLLHPIESFVAHFFALSHFCVMDDR
jgi:hypothetical protein